MLQNLFRPLILILILSACGISKSNGWKLQHQQPTVASIHQKDSVEVSKAEEKTESPVIARLEKPEIADETFSELILPQITTHSSYKEPTIVTKSVQPKKERTEIQKIHRSFRRQATWFMVFSIISFYLGLFMLIDIDGLVSASPFFLLTIVGFVAFGIAIKYMVKAKRIMKKPEPLNEEDQLQMAELRKMKKLGFRGVMGGLGLGILSIIILTLYILF